MAVPSDPPSGTTDAAFNTWAQNVSDTAQDHDTRISNVVVKENTDTDGASTEIWSADTTTPRGDFRWVVEDTAVFNGDLDPVMKFGYNVGQELAAEGSLFWTIEGHFDNGSAELLEGHLEGTANDGTSVRPFTFTVNKATAEVAGAIKADSFVFYDDSENAVAQYVPSRFDVNQDFRVIKATGNVTETITGTAGSAILNINGAAASESRLTWSRGGTQAWYAYTTGSNDLRFRDITNGREHMKFVPGASVSAARTDVLATFRFNHADFFQTTVGGAGAASALPANPTKYLKVQDSAGTTFVVPCYAAS